MKTKRKFLSILLAVCIIFTLAPLTASAADSHNFVITKDGVCIEVTDDNSADILEDGGSVSYDKATNTLTLNNCNFTANSGQTYYDIGIYKSASELNIKLVGDNIVRGAINASNGLKISGEGTLDVIAVRPTSGELLIDGCSIQAEWIRGDEVRIINNADVTAEQTGNTFGIFAYDKLYIENSKVTGISESDLEFSGIFVQNGSAEIRNSMLIASSKMDSGIVVQNGNLTIVGSYVEATSEENEYGVSGIWAIDLSISGNSEVVANAACGNAVYADNQLIVDNSVLNATAPGDYPAIYAYGNIDIRNGSDVTGLGNFRGIFTDSSMMVTDSTVIARGTTKEGMVVVGALVLSNSSLTASSKPDDYIPAIITKNLDITNSEVTANGGLDLFDWNSGDTDNISLRIASANGKLVEFKVDGDNWDGSAAKHFKEGSESPYDTAVNFSAEEMNWLGVYRYIYIGDHIHTGGTANCEMPAICEDCGRTYGSTNPDYHQHVEKTNAKPATCTEEGNIEYWHCEVCDEYYSDIALTKEITKEETVVKATGHGETELKNAKEATCIVEGYTGDKVCKACGLVMEKGKVTAKAAHNFKDGECTVCKATAPNYVSTKPTVPEKGNKESPQTGDSTNIALWLAIMLTVGTALTGTVLYSKKRKRSK